MTPEANEYPSSSPQERRDAVENVRDALRELRREIDPRNPTDGTAQEQPEQTPEINDQNALEQLVSALQVLRAKHENVNSEAWTTLEQAIGAELAALGADSPVEALRVALEDNETRENDDAARLELEDLAEELGAVDAYREAMPGPSIQDRVWGFFEKIQDPATRVMVVQFVASILERFPFLAFLTGTMRYRADLEQSLADETLSQEDREKLESRETQTAWTARYNRWMQRKAAAEGAVPPQPFAEPAPTLLDVVNNVPEPGLPASAETTNTPQDLFGVEGMKHNESFTVQEDLKLELSVRDKPIKLSRKELEIENTKFAFKMNDTQEITSMELKATDPSDAGKILVTLNSAAVSPELSAIVAKAEALKNDPTETKATVDGTSLSLEELTT